MTGWRIGMAALAAAVAASVPAVLWAPAAQAAPPAVLAYVTKATPR